ncbi:BRO-N domain-containing protein [Faucicola boevrei]|uniref:BRO-N domain-containing protein n=1 Tax=Faucicola boevrei TaxID=346665 RepID=UPI000364121C|nr:BRO family protein [Moraxella boevrei]
MRTLTFQNITLTPIKVDNQIWLTSSELAKALDYADTQSVTKIYERNADEFTSSMTTIAEVKTNGGLQKTRIFSLKGCHLIAMFARTAVAKQFRQWVLDILDKEVGQPTIQKTNAHQRQALVTACDKLAVGNTLRSDIYKMVGNQFGVDDIQSIPMHQLADATAFVYEIILTKQQTPKTQELPQKTIERLAKQFAKTAILINHVKNEYLPFLYTANFAKAEKVSVHLALINYDIQDNCRDLLKLLPSQIKNDKAHPIVSELQTAYYHDNLLKCPQKIV